MKIFFASLCSSLIQCLAPRYDAILKNVFAVRGAILSLVHQFHVACLYHSSHGKHGPSLEFGLHRYDLCVHFPYDRMDCYVETPLILLGVSYHPLGVDLLLPGVDLILPYFVTLEPPSE